MPRISTLQFVLNITRSSLPATPPLAPLSTSEGETPWCSLWYDTLYSIHAVLTVRFEFFDMTLQISPGGSDVELVPLAALISKSAGGSGSRSADVGVSSADFSCTSSSLSLNASRRSCNYAFRDLLGGYVGYLTGGLPL
jgi:hypothetical protein